MSSTDRSSLPRVRQDGSAFPLILVGNGRARRVPPRGNRPAFLKSFRRQGIGARRDRGKSSGSDGRELNAEASCTTVGKILQRSEERRVGKECRSGRAQDP